MAEPLRRAARRRLVSRSATAHAVGTSRSRETARPLGVRRRPGRREVAQRRRQHPPANARRARRRAGVTAPMPATVVAIHVDAWPSRAGGRHVDRAGSDEDGAAASLAQGWRDQVAPLHEGRAGAARRQPAGVRVMRAMPDRVAIVEVGPRDGLQNESALVSTADKIAFVDRLSAAGHSTIEVSAFVSPKRVPQMADAAEVFAGIERRDGRALHGAGAKSRRPRSSPGGEGQRDRDLRGRVRDVQPAQHQSVDRGIVRGVRGNLPIGRGRRPARARLSVDLLWLSVRRASSAEPGSAELSARLIDLGVFEVAVSDTIGVAHPGQVPIVLDAVSRRVPIDRIALHFHDTRGTALANVLAGARLRRHDVRQLVGRAGRVSVRARARRAISRPRTCSTCSMDSG